MAKKQRKSGTAVIFMTLAALGAITLPWLTNPTALAQTPSVQPQCTDVEIQKHIQQLNKGESVDFNAVVACTSKAVPALIKALENQDESFRIIAIAALGEIGVSAAPSVPILTKSLQDPNRDIRIIVVYALRQIGQDPVSPLIQALKSKDWTIRYSAAKALGQFGTEARDAVPALNIALKDTNITVRFAADNALREINGANLNDTESEEFYPDVSNVSQATMTHFSTNPPVMCRIPVIKTVLKWKCP